jgi:AraC-like DNA-binding protein
MSIGYHFIFIKMKKEEPGHLKFDSISDAHRIFGLPQPMHPLISLISGSPCINIPEGSHVLNFYKIAYKPQPGGKLKYGQHYYDFDGGGLMFASPNQIVGHAEGDKSVTQNSVYTLLIHPDFLWNYPLAKNIKQFGFFSYSANETLHLSPQEEATIISIFKMIEEELASRIDDFSQNVVISQIELLLNFANRFYKRQFITRKAVNSDLLEKLDTLLDNYFDKETALNKGVPSVQYLADALNLSANYLSDMLRALIGQTAQHYIHSKLIDKAKERLSTTNLSVSEVAYALGFEHPQSFSKLFKSKTNLSPLEFRKSFN